MNTNSSQMMNFINLFIKESDVSTKKLVFIAITSSIAESIALAVILAVAKTASSTDLNFRYFLMYVIIVIISIYGKKFTFFQSNLAAETMVRKIKVRIVDKIRKCDLIFLETIGLGEIYTKITTNTQLISMSTFMITCGVQSAILTLFCIFYIAMLSKLAFFITIIALIVIIMKYMQHEKVFASDYHKVIMLDSKFCDMVNDTLTGFKELKMNEDRSEDHFSFFTKIVTESETLNVKALSSFAAKMIFTQTSFYMLLAATGFILPRLGESYSDLIMAITTVILFLIGPVNLVIASIPNFFKVNVSLSALYKLEDMLASKIITKSITDEESLNSFNEIKWENVTFNYRDKENNILFTVGPINFSIKRGEILFIVGGNGSGKSTLLKLITALYYPDSGNIKLDNESISYDSYSNYRKLFSAIFADFHLFDRLYGFKDIDYQKISQLLKIMKIEKKIEIKDGQFSTINLSTGQKKRIAMIVALLEDKPIYVFDEWAADQDPSFKKYFYETLLNDLKTQGKTVIVVSHDDRYFHHAERVLKMEFGRFDEI
ncbi:MAG: cyclic peptide export ABC transporter [Desulfobacterales bacterium]|nr:cyclic peptide export ABC transporter [Desulfobacterales bacterium]